MIWENLVGAVVDGRFRLRALTHAGRDQAEFMAESSAEAGVRPLTLTLLAAAGEEVAHLHEQLSQVSSLRHANLLEIVGAGSWRPPSGEELFYLASETPDETLAAVCPVTEDALPSVLRDVLEALAFLHKRGLVHRGLEPQTIVRVGSRWKLADYGRLHPAGAPDPQIGSFLNGSRYTPPEAYSGLVLPAWDIWDVGSLMMEALTGRPDDGVLPSPFEEAARRCLEPSPDARPDLDGIRAILGLPKAPAVAPAPPIVQRRAPEPPPEPPRVVERRPEARAAVRVSAVADGTRKYWPIGAALAALVLLGILFGAHRRPAQEPVKVDSSEPAPVTPRAIAEKAVPPEKPSATSKNAVAAPEKPAVVEEAALAPAKAPAHHRASKGEVGMADYASARSHGLRTASGERFDNHSLTAAHRTYPLGSRVRVTNLKNGRSVVVRINDRGLHRRGYVIRVTRRVAEQLKFTSAGSARVRVEEVD